MGRLCPPGESQASSGQESRWNQAQPATLRLLLQAGKLRPKDPLPTAGVRGFAGGHRGFLGQQPIRAKPVPRHRGVPAHTEGPLGLGYLEGCVSAQECTVRAGPGASQLRPSLSQSNLRHLSTQPHVDSGHPSPPSLEWEQGVRITTGQRPGRHGPSLPIPLGQHRVELSLSPPQGLEARATLLCLCVLEPWVSL